MARLMGTRVPLEAGSPTYESACLLSHLSCAVFDPKGYELLKGSLSLQLAQGMVYSKCPVNTD